VARLVASEIAKQNLSIEKSKAGQIAKHDEGVIILTSSTSYQDGQVGQVGYAASKGGVASMVLPMARDLARFGKSTIDGTN
jgi:NAD(P)-dependent dehydrogenase (short-subunit alcohol dehydrogenase family)